MELPLRLSSQNAKINAQDLEHTFFNNSLQNGRILNFFFRGHFCHIALPFTPQ